MALLDWAEMASEQTKASDTKVGCRTQIPSPRLPSSLDATPRSIELAVMMTGECKSLTSRPQVEEELTLEEDDLFEEFEDQVVDEVGKEQLWQVCGRRAGAALPRVGRGLGAIGCFH